MEIYYCDKVLALENEVKKQIKAMGATPVFSNSPEIFEVNSTFGLREAVKKTSLSKGGVIWTPNILNMSGSSSGSSGLELSVIILKDPQCGIRTRMQQLHHQE